MLSPRKAWTACRDHNWFPTTSHRIGSKLFRHFRCLDCPERTVQVTP